LLEAASRATKRKLRGLGGVRIIAIKTPYAESYIIGVV
jgi:hypothetical protein